MEIKKAEFVISSSDVHRCPFSDKAEYAFIGRSNVGKSSLINMLVNNKKLAKISQQPGKTQLINHFKINDEWFLVDLPGYGYAKVSKIQRKKFERLINDYVIMRKNLFCLFVLVDARLEPQKIDLDFMTNLGERRVPFVIVMTKADKLGTQKLKTMYDNYVEKLSEIWEEVPRIFVSSAVKNMGKEEILNFIDEINKQDAMNA